MCKRGEWGAGRGRFIIATCRLAEESLCLAVTRRAPIYRLTRYPGSYAQFYLVMVKYRNKNNQRTTRLPSDTEKTSPSFLRQFG